METYRFATEMKISASLEEVFRFFSRAENLERITPPWLRFKILSPLPIKMKAGTIIDYRLSLYKLPVHWQTEISLWDPPNRFIDRQRQGPYKNWIHEHTFIAVDDGCLIRDLVQYELHGAFLSPLINRLFVRKDIQRIFAHRTKIIESIFKDSFINSQ